MVAHNSLTLDTNAFIHFQQGEQFEYEQIINSNILLIPVIVIGELTYGFLNSKRKTENLKLLDNFLNQPQVKTVAADEMVAREFGQIKYKLKIAGTPIPTNDIWIAATAITQNSKLLTRDKHFQYIVGLDIVV